jgi:hypothetical protein
VTVEDMGHADDLVVFVTAGYGYPETLGERAANSTPPIAAAALLPRYRCLPQRHNATTHCFDGRAGTAYELGGYRRPLCSKWLPSCDIQRVDTITDPSPFAGSFTS